MPARCPWRLSLLLLVLPGFGGCASVVRYTDALVGARDGRTWFTRFPATFGATAGFVIGVPFDIAAWPATFVYYRSQPKETRDAVSTFLFPSIVLWKAFSLVGAPFDFVEWGTVRWWQASPPVTDQERQAIERAWDAKEYSEYPVTPVYPRPAEVDS